LARRTVKMRGARSGSATDSAGVRGTPKGDDVVHIYVVNLARSTDRRAHIHSQLAKVGIPYEIVDAIDGRELDLGDPEIAKLIDSSVLQQRTLLPGEIACAMSHLRAYEKMIADGRDFALILEDDVVLPCDLSALVEAAARGLHGAEVVLLSFDSSHGTIQVSLEDVVELGSARTLALPIDVDQILSAAAYLVTREACERMASMLLPVRAKADEWAFRFNEGMLDRVRCVVPVAVSKSSVFASTMDYNPQDGLKVRILDYVAQADLGLAKKLIAYRRELIWRRISRVEFSDAPFINKPSRP
jgi:glycosyl transferase family 25